MTAQYHVAGHEGMQAIPCKEKAANLFTLNEEYQQASDLYRDIGASKLKYNLTKYQASKSFFRSILLLLAMDKDICDMEKVKQSLYEMMVLDPMFRVSPCCDFLTNILSILHSIRSIGSEAALDDFSDHVYDYDKFYPFDIWNLEILDRIHKTHFEESVAS